MNLVEAQYDELNFSQRMDECVRNASFWEIDWYSNRASQIADAF